MDVFYSWGLLRDERERRCVRGGGGVKRGWVEIRLWVFSNSFSLCGKIRTILFLRCNSNVHNIFETNRWGRGLSLRPPPAHSKTDDNNYLVQYKPIGPAALKLKDRQASHLHMDRPTVSA